MAMKKGELKRLAEETGRTMAHIHYVLSGERTAGEALAQKLAELTGRPVTDFRPERKGDTDNGTPS